MEVQTPDSTTLFAYATLFRSDLASIENVTGSTYDDELRGDAGANRLDGGAGNDRLEGREGDDTLYMSGGADRKRGRVDCDHRGASHVGFCVKEDLTYTAMEVQ